MKRISNYKNTLLSILLIYIFLACLKENEPYFVHDLQGVFIYSSPEFSSKILKRLPFNSPLIQLEKREDGWVKISSSGIKGYSYNPDIKKVIADIYQYVDSLDGLKLYEKPSEKSKIVDTVVHKSRLKIHEIDQANGTFKKLNWALVEGVNIMGYARLDYLSNEPKSYFYSIVKSKGQTLRSMPGENSPVLTSLPLNHIGEILEKSSDLEINSNNKGYWFRTEFKGKMGWIFSAYTVTSLDRKYLEDRDYIRNEEWFMRYMDSAVKVENIHISDKELMSYKKESFEQENFEIYQLKYPNSIDDCNVSTISRIVFRNKLNSQTFSIKGLYSEDLISLDKPFPNTIYTRYESCHCCCPDTGNLLYFLMEDSIYFVHYKEENNSASCLYGPIEGVELERENRFDPENNIIYMNLRLPLCDLSSGQESESTKPVGFAHNLFAVLKKEKNKILVEKYYDKGIPDSYREVWENAIQNFELATKSK